jgi:alpha-mannosidase
VDEIGLTVLRSPIYAHHIPAELEPDISYRYIDQGEQRFAYTLLPHTGSWETAGTVRYAAELNQPPFALWTTFHEGLLPQSFGYVYCEPDNVAVNVIKQAEDGDDLIVRAYETAKVATSATIRLPQWNRTISARFGPCEIKTFRVPADESLPITETNLLELGGDVAVG